MLTNDQIATLKKELINQKEMLERDAENTEINESARDAVGELSAYDNHPGDLGTELFEREKDMALKIHSEAELTKIHDALQAIENGSYGVCEDCGKPIPFERLEAIPYTTFCKEHTPEQGVPRDRPSEETVLHPSNDNTFANRHKGEVQDFQDSFQEVAKYGTSETPQDFTGDKDNYSELYDDEIRDGFTEEYESFSSNDITGKDERVYNTEEKIQLEDELDNEGIDAPFGDLPYKYTDGYVQDNEKTK